MGAAVLGFAVRGECERALDGECAPDMVPRRGCDASRGYAGRSDDDDDDDDECEEKFGALAPPALLLVVSDV